MSTPAYQIPAPEALSFESADWSKWIERFERFRTASGLINKPEAEQGLEKLKTSYKENAKPYAIMVLRRVPIPLKDALQKKLYEMIA
ncbi:hypothetical protein AVEN_266124-1 [Araneus ventricosus]|uniref:Uncharacterized protein n=1 Tax=Araneus ventricosus TaxID=182803 RepID=A0A4Y2GAV4_ARAVE|nr:hypothetical protein AVEN_266124-1 [Araneus ventricosus]